MSDIELTLQPNPIEIDLTVSRVQLEMSPTEIVVQAIAQPIEIDLQPRPIEIEITGVGAQGPQGLPGTAATHSEVPAGTVNGSNQNFTLTYLPAAGSLMLFVNGLLQTMGYVLSGSTITFDSDAVPLPGDGVYATYRVDG